MGAADELDRGAHLVEEEVGGGRPPAIGVLDRVAHVLVIPVLQVASGNGRGW